MVKKQGKKSQNGDLKRNAKNIGLQIWGPQMKKKKKTN